MIDEERQQEHRRKSRLDHVFHVWINARQEIRRADGLPFESNLYEFKTALQEVDRLPYWLGAARTGTLRTTHQQCSQQEPETIQQNQVICALAVDVTECPILAHFYATFTEQNQSKFGPTLTLEDADQAAAKICAWHIYSATLETPFLDTSEGYIQDESDRKFWSKTYEHMAAGLDDDEPEDEPDEPYLGRPTLVPL